MLLSRFQYDVVQDQFLGGRFDLIEVACPLQDVFRLRHGVVPHKLLGQCVHLRVGFLLYLVHFFIRLPCILRIRKRCG